MVPGKIFIFGVILACPLVESSIQNKTQTELPNESRHILNVGVKRDVFFLKAFFEKVLASIEQIKLFKALIQPVRLTYLFLEPEFKAFLCLIEFFKVRYPQITLPNIPQTGSMVDFILLNIFETLKPFLTPIIPLLSPPLSNLLVSQTDVPQGPYVPINSNPFLNLLQLLKNVGVYNSSETNMQDFESFYNNEQNVYSEPTWYQNTSITPTPPMNISRTKRNVLPFPILAVNYPTIALGKCAVLYTFDVFWRWIEF